MNLDESILEDAPLQWFAPFRARTFIEAGYPGLRSSDSLHPQNELQFRMTACGLAITVGPFGAGMGGFSWPKRGEGW